MFIIQTLELAKMAALPEAIGITRTTLNDCAPQRDANPLRDEVLVLAIAPSLTQATLLTPVLHPRMAHQFEGFEITPSDLGIRVQVLKNLQVMVHSPTEGWQPSLNPLASYIPDQIRQTLPDWVGGAIQFRLILQKIDTFNPCIAALKVGYTVEGDLLSYLLKVALPKFFAVPIKLARWSQTDANGLSLPLPNGFDPNQIPTVTVFVPELKPQVGAISGTPPRITVPLTLPDLDIQVVFEFIPKVTFETGLFEPGSLPCVVLRLLSPDNARQSPNMDSIRLQGSMIRIWQTAAQYDQMIEVSVLGSTLEDVRAIANHLMQLADSNGDLEAFPFALKASLQLKRGLRMNDARSIQTGQTSQGNFHTASFRVALLNLTEAESTQDVPTIETSDRDIAPKLTEATRNAGVLRPDSH